MNLEKGENLCGNDLSSHPHPCRGPMRLEGESGPFGRRSEERRKGGAKGGNPSVGGEATTHAAQCGGSYRARRGLKKRTGASKGVTRTPFEGKTQ